MFYISSASPRLLNLICAKFKITALNFEICERKRNNSELAANGEMVVSIEKKTGFKRSRTHEKTSAKHFAIHEELKKKAEKGEEEQGM